MTSSIQLSRECHVQPSSEEAGAINDLRDQINAIFERQQSAFLIGPDGEQVPIPASAFAALRQVVEGMSQGLSMTLVPTGMELTTQQAADVLHVSRPHLVSLLERGDIPFHRVGTHRRVLMTDVLNFRRRRALDRKEQLDELTRIAEESESGYA